MKRGIENTMLNQDPMDIDSPISTFLPELFPIVTSFLPAYHLAGFHSINTVCKQWNERLNSDPLILPRRSVKKLVDSCKTADDTLYIFNDETLIKHLSFDHFLHVLACHPEMTINIIQQFGIENFLDEIKKQVWLSTYILSADNPAELGIILEVQFDAIKTLACADLSLAEYLLSKFPLAMNLGLVQEGELSLNLPPVIQEIMTQDEFIADHAHEFLLDLGKAHLPIAWRFIKMSKTHLEQHSFYSLAALFSALGIAHLPIAEHFMKNPDILDVLEIQDLVKLGKAHVSLRNLFK